MRGAGGEAREPAPDEHPPVTLLLTFVVAVGSALLPLINAEAYLLGVNAIADGGGWALALAASAGQTVGKLVLFLAARGAISAPWLTRWRRPRGRHHRPARDGRVQRWVRRVQQQRHGAVVVVAASASIGLPPLLATSVLAGATTMRATTFAVTCLLGRWARFGVLLAAPTLLFA